MVNKKIEHLSVIMDGNRRWAKSQGLDIYSGYDEGCKKIRLLLELSIKQNIKYVSTYAFSSENWKRNKLEIDYLTYLINYYIKNEKEFFIKNKIKLLVIGDYSKFGSKIEKSIQKIHQETENFDTLTLVLALNYGSRLEILRAVNNLVCDIKDKKLLVDEIDEVTFSKYLYTYSIPDPDILLRTGGEKRLSNFLLWQCSYTEFIFKDFMWPEFNESVFNKVLEDYKIRERRFGY